MSNWFKRRKKNKFFEYKDNVQEMNRIAEQFGITNPPPEPTIQSGGYTYPASAFPPQWYDTVPWTIMKTGSANPFQSTVVYSVRPMSDFQWIDNPSPVEDMVEDVEFD